MLFTNAFVLFSSAMLVGSAVFIIPTVKPIYFKLSLAFSGAYLFTLTLVHILPELFAESTSPFQVGIFVVAGFLMQVLLDFFTEGVEHGHFHTHKLNTTTLLGALFVHALLEGTLLSHPSHTHESGETHSLLFGIVIHKIPEAFAFASVLLLQLGKKSYVLLLIFIFSLATPIGILLTNYLNVQQVVSLQFTQFLLGIVAGNFLHISTTIFFETSPQHQFNGLRLFFILLGVALAILSEGMR
jgi:zinc and cadmium transporter